MDRRAGRLSEAYRGRRPTGPRGLGRRAGDVRGVALGGALPTRREPMRVLPVTRVDTGRGSEGDRRLGGFWSCWPHAFGASMAVRRILGLLLASLLTACPADESGAVAFPSTDSRNECLRSLRPAGFRTEPRHHAGAVSLAYWGASPLATHLWCSQQQCSVEWIWPGASPSREVVATGMNDVRRLLDAMASACSIPRDEIVCRPEMNEFAGCP